MISVTLLILQIVGLLTYPAVLASILSGKNIVKYIADMDCNQDDKDVKATCEQMKSYKWRVLSVMILYLVAIIFFTFAIWYQYKQNHVYNILVLLGSLCSLVGVGVLTSIIVGVSKDVSNYGGGSSTKYLWLVNALTLVFNIITVIIGLFSSIKEMRHPGSPV